MYSEPISNPSRLLSLPWSDPRWTPSEYNANNYRPQTSGSAPRKLRIGELKQRKEPENPPTEISETIAIPPSRIIKNITLAKPQQEPENTNFPTSAFVSIRAHSTLMGEKLPGHLAIFSHDTNSRKVALAAMQSMALRIICTFPVRKLRCTFIDPIDMGSNFSFNGKLPEQMVGQQVYTNSSSVREQLQALNIHVEEIIQNRLGIDYKTIEEFNQANPIVEEAYRYLFIADFPNAFDNGSIEIIESLLRNGARAGVYVILHIDQTIEEPRSFKYENLNNYCTVIHPTTKNEDGKILFTTPLIQEHFNILLDEPPSKDQFNQLTNIIATTFKEIKTETFPFTDLYSDAETAWSSKYDSRQQIRTPIGLMGAAGHLEFWMGQNEDGQFTNFGLLAGKPRAGKSYTLHAIIIGLAMRYAPDELEMYLLDYKKGVEFQIYVNPEITKCSSDDDDLVKEKCLPHAKVVSIDSNREFGLSVLEYIQEQIEQRSQKFKSARNSTNLKEYRDNSGEKLSRILVVIDEFQVLFIESDSITSSLNQIFDNIIKQGPAFGIHLLLATQSPSIANLSSGIYKNIELRMAHQMDKSVASSMLSEGNSDAIDLVDKPGKLLYNREFGKKSHNQICQVADVSPEARIKALQYIQSIAKIRGYRRTEPPIVFRGSELAKLKDNLQLTQLFNRPDWLSSKELKLFIQEKDWTVQETPGVTWLGESMRLGNHTKAIFRRRPSNNMLLVGSSEETIFGLLGGILLSLVNSYEPKQAQFNIIDLSPDEDSQWAEMSTTFRDAFQSYFPVTVGKRFAKTETNIYKGEYVLEETFSELESRKEKRKENPDELNLASSRFLIYAVGGLNYAPNLMPVAGRRGEETSSDAQKLLELLSKGSELGIHTILWLNNMNTFRGLTEDNRSWLNYFGLRVALKMPLDDSRQLLGEGYAQNLSDTTAYFWDKAITTEPEKFKPYAVPSVGKIIEYSNKLKKRSLL